MREKILIVDAWNLMIAQNSVSNILDFNSEPQGMYLTTINQLKNYTEIHKPQKIFFVLDGPNAGERRRKIFPGYKNKRRVTSRSSTVKLYHEEDKKEVEVYTVDGAFEKQLVKIHEFIKLLPITLLIIPYCEGDDVITYLALKNQNNYNIVICSTDKDYLQLINENISVYNWRIKALINKERFIEDFKILPKNYIFQKILLGDKSDAISNIKSIGKKAFEAIFQKIFLQNNSIETVSDLIKIIENLNKEDIPKKFQKHLVLLNSKESIETLILNFKLIKLQEENLKPHHIEILKRQIEEQKDKGFSKMMAKVKMLNDGFNKLYGTYANFFDADKFLQTFVFVNSKNNILV